MVACGIAAPDISLTCPETTPAVCADNLAADDITRINAKMQQAMEALHRLRLVPLTKLFNMVDFLLFCCLEQPLLN
jgi:hypothetical protein